MDKVRKKAYRVLADRIMERERQEEIEAPGVLIHRSDGDYDWEDHIFLVEADSEQEAIISLEDHYPVHGITLTPSAYDCTGRLFCEPAEAKRAAPGRYLVKLNTRRDL